MVCPTPVDLHSEGTASNTYRSDFSFLKRELQLEKEGLHLLLQEVYFLHLNCELFSFAQSGNVFSTFQILVDIHNLRGETVRSIYKSGNSGVRATTTFPPILAVCLQQQGRLVKVVLPS